ncbi:FAD:protein FMN transferase [Putridiphycobacter roseus]|uniref:FAD:protein FMN transferase n=1 Tax=Putridiphycobacter roseus TaxID=2219161 RepID=A0A2W1NFG5_9FLAO|nr:FAD:protein FMN transferase [Putridiphycobacter roseus]PZE16756.1 FAD:protein FMN transferase [Putridiphycobacter roseus]
MARSNRRRKLNLSLGLLILPFLQINCTNPSDDTGFETLPVKKENLITLYGNTQGTTYAILCNDPIQLEQEEIDQTLSHFDTALSTYIPTSIISKFNEAPAGRFTYKDTFQYFNDCMKVSTIIYNQTKGAFDPSVFPLLEDWGFLKDITEIPDSNTVKETKKRTGFRPNYHYEFYPSETAASTIIKKTPGFKLVFNAIAQGQSVDVIADLLAAKGAKNYFIEVGGELRVHGKNAEGNNWTIGIDKPIENSTANNREIMEIIALENKAVATSGSYRQFYEKSGKKYSHTIDPATGFPVTHQLLSVTVIANDCASADGYATAFMVMGTDKTKEFVATHPALDLDIYLIYNENNKLLSYASEGFKSIIK